VTAGPHASRVRRLLSSPRGCALDSRRVDDQRGQVSLLVIGMVVTLLMAIAVVVDASAAFLQRQGLDTMADGAALHGSDFGATATYGTGIPDGYLTQQPAGVESVVRQYLADIGAHRAYPGLQVDVRATDERVTVTLSAPLDLPLTVPGSPDRAVVGATGHAAVKVSR
jgi:hypothetical protein